MIKTENLTILFVDIAGFTATTSRQSRAENARLLQTFGSTLLPLIKGYKGRLIKTIGDALLITFRSPTDAMLCSMALQDAMHAHNLSAPNGDKIHIRVAANLGEVRVTKNDIFGEPVNVASRIEGVAPADEIYLSEAVYMAMNKAEVPAKEVGTRELAGVSQPVRLYNIPRFSTHRLVPEDADADEKGSELLYPYGGMHCQPRSKGLSCLLHLPDKKGLPRLLIPIAAVCIIVLAVISGYRHFMKPASAPTSISQPAAVQTPPEQVMEMQDTKVETTPLKTEVQMQAHEDKEATALKEAPEKDTQKSAALTDMPQKTTTVVQTPEPKEVKKEQTTGSGTTASKETKEQYPTGTWSPESKKAEEVVKEGYATGTWSPEPEKVEEEIKEEVKEGYATGTWSPETKKDDGQYPTGTWSPEDDE